MLRVCELFCETIRKMFGCGCYFVVECYYYYFYVCCSERVRVCGNFCCVAAIVKDIFQHWSVEVCCIFM